MRSCNSYCEVSNFLRGVVLALARLIQFELHRHAVAMRIRLRRADRRQLPLISSRRDFPARPGSTATEAIDSFQ